MDIKLTKNWKRRNKTISKGTTVMVDRATGLDLIKKKIGKEVKETFFTKLFDKGVDLDTKQTAKYKKDDPEEDQGKEEDN